MANRSDIAWIITLLKRPQLIKKSTAPGSLNYGWYFRIRMSKAHGCLGNTLICYTPKQSSKAPTFISRIKHREAAITSARALPLGEYPFLKHIL